MTLARGLYRHLTVTLRPDGRWHLVGGMTVYPGRPYKVAYEIYGSLGEHGVDLGVREVAEAFHEAMQQLLARRG